MRPPADNLDRLRRRNARLRAWLDGVAAAVGAALVADGWHQHNRQWRRKRGAAMRTLATGPTAEQVRNTWVPAELSAMAGQLDPASAENAAKGDAAALPAVDAFLSGNPAAVALWGDVGRWVLQKWVKLYAGDCLTTQRAVYRFASDLRAGLAGPRAGALDFLLAERVVIGWVFLHWCGGQYAALLGKMTWKDSEYHTKRIEMANRNLMSACGTLAKVKRCKLSEVLALVNAAPPVGPSTVSPEHPRPRKGHAVPASPDPSHRAEVHPDGQDGHKDVVRQRGEVSQ